jgi:DNA-binding response OmpR family regulator
LIAVWKQAYLGSEKTVDTHLSWIRSKLGETATSARYLRTVRGVGVKLVAPDD